MWFIGYIVIVSLLLFVSFSGSRSAVVNMEARSPGAAMLNRKCVLIKWSELTSQLLSELIERGAGALLIILPTNWRGMTHNDTINVSYNGGHYLEILVEGVHV